MPYELLWHIFEWLDWKWWAKEVEEIDDAVDFETDKEAFYGEWLDWNRWREVDWNVTNIASDQ